MSGLRAMAPRCRAATSLVAIVAIAWGSAGCGAASAGADRAEGDGAGSPLVTTERSQRGGQLVLMGAGGARNAPLTRASGALQIDRSPAFSPDGEWIAFASTRDRDSLEETSLWIVRAEPDAKPERLTSAGAVDRDPAWMPGGDAIVFASTRGGSFDLYVLPLTGAENGPPTRAGPPEVLTDTPAQALAPSVAPDGDQVAFMALDESPQSASLWLVEVSTHAQKQITEGPRDTTPAWSPRGDVIAFSAPAPGRHDSELFAVEPAGGERRQLTDEPLADQTGPTFSDDGRYLFATAVYRSAATGEPILSSVVVLDRHDPRGVLRGLHDPAYVESRIGVDFRPGASAEGLGENPPYEDALREAVASELRRERREQEESAE